MKINKPTLKVFRHGDRWHWKLIAANHVTMLVSNAQGHKTQDLAISEMLAVQTWAEKKEKPNDSISYEESVFFNTWWFSILNRAFSKTYRTKKGCYDGAQRVVEILRGDKCIIGLMLEETDDLHGTQAQI